MEYLAAFLTTSPYHVNFTLALTALNLVGASPNHFSLCIYPLQNPSIFLSVFIARGCTNCLAAYSLQTLSMYCELELSVLEEKAR
jgi:hypothetical protein